MTTQDRSQKLPVNLPADTFRRLKETAGKQGFRDVSALIMHISTAYAWPEDRVTITGDHADFKQWNRAALKQAMTLDDWMIQTMNAASPGADIIQFEKQGG